MDIGLVFKIAGVGVIVAVIVQVLKQAGRDDIAILAVLAGLIAVLTVTVGAVSQLFDTLRRVFDLY